MRKHLLVSVALSAFLMGPAAAQNAQRGGVRTETMERLDTQDSGNDLIWNLIGLLGLLGLLGLRSEHPDDSYHPAPVE
jgi:hypothetical protein